MKHRLKDLQHKKLQQNNLKTRRIEKPQPLKAQSLKNVYSQKLFYRKSSSAIYEQKRHRKHKGKPETRMEVEIMIDWDLKQQFGLLKMN